MGEKMVLFSDINNLIICIGVLMTYQKFIYSFASSILEAFFDIETKSVNVQIIMILSCFLFIQIPLTLIRKMQYLQYVSIIGSIMLLYSIIIIVIKSYMQYKIARIKYEIIEFEKFGWNHINAMSIFLFGFCCHNGVLQVLIELNRPSKNRFVNIQNRSFVLQILLYFAISFFGYFSFLGGTKDNILSNYPNNDMYIFVSKILLFFCLHCSLAINYNIMRLSFKSLWLKPGEKNFSFLKDLFFSFLTLFICNIFVYYVKSITNILGIVGGFSTVVICFLNPIMIYVLSNGYSRYSLYNLFAYFILMFTGTVGILSTSYNLYYFIISQSKDK